MRIIIEMDPRPAVKRDQVTEEYIRENQRLNRLQREKERAYRNANSTSNNGQDTEDKDKS